eukprot:scaffold155_cov347-Pavlova_lutheri.AAC.54
MEGSMSTTEASFFPRLVRPFLRPSASFRASVPSARLVAFVGKRQSSALGGMRSSLFSSSSVSAVAPPDNRSSIDRDSRTPSRAGCRCFRTRLPRIGTGSTRCIRLFLRLFPSS